MRKEALHVFGVDFFSEKDIMDFFGDFQPVKVEWINDSSCNVVFPSEEQSTNARFSKTTVIENNEQELDWRRGLDIEKEGKNFNFFVRYATMEVS